MVTIKLWIPNSNSSPPWFWCLDAYGKILCFKLAHGFDRIFFQDVIISAFDRDIHFSQLTFSLEDTDLFSIESVADSITGSKNYIARLLTTKQITKFSDDIEFTLIATVISPIIFFLVIITNGIHFLGFISRRHKKFASSH